MVHRFAKPIEIFADVLDVTHFDNVDHAVGGAHPEVHMLCCVDPRSDRRHFKRPPGTVVMPSRFAANIPADQRLAKDLVNTHVLAETKGAKFFGVKIHSDCAAAGICLQFAAAGAPSGHPQAALTNLVLADLWELNIDLVRASKLAFEEAEGCQELAINLLAKEFSRASLRNYWEWKVSQNMTKTVGEAVQDGDISLAVIFADYQRGGFEYLDPKTFEFRTYDPTSPSTDMNISSVEALIREDAGCSCHSKVHMHGRATPGASLDRR